MYMLVCAVDSGSDVVNEAEAEAPAKRSNCTLVLTLSR